MSQCGNVFLLAVMVASPFACTLFIPKEMFAQHARDTW